MLLRVVDGGLGPHVAELVPAEQTGPAEDQQQADAEGAGGGLILLIARHCVDEIEQLEESHERRKDDFDLIM